MGAGIKAAGLTMTYGSLRAVEDVTFEVVPGEFFGLLGPNGAGKTTTLEMIEGLRAAESGTVTIDGVSCGAQVAPPKIVEKPRRHTKPQLKHNGDEPYAKLIVAGGRSVRPRRDT